MKNAGKTFLILLCFGLLFSSCKNPQRENKNQFTEDEINVSAINPINEGHKLIIDMVAALGGQERVKELKDVEFKYTYHNLGSDLKDITLERYIFNGEISWCRYELRERYFADKKGLVIQSFDGETTQVSFEGKDVEDPKIIARADFTRKTNYYWFLMMFKLMDDGISYEKMEDQYVGDQNYQRVKISYDVGVGDVQDTYLLYINPQTGLVDQFLFTIMDFDVKEPFLMVVDYEEIQGLKLMVHRKYRKSNWEGEAISDDWAAETWAEDIKFENEFKIEDLSPIGN